WADDGLADPKGTPGHIVVIIPSMAWKISATTDEGVVAENVGGESMTFASDTLVVEISREGFERMASRS
ncbi:MAG: hypothetical protein AAFX99_21825, partial [Myxococcota bacterium]